MFPGAIVAGPLDYINVNVGLLSMLASSWGTSPITCALGTEFGCRVASYLYHRNLWHTSQWRWESHCVHVPIHAFPRAHDYFGMNTVQCTVFSYCWWLPYLISLTSYTVDLSSLWTLKLYTVSISLTSITVDQTDLWLISLVVVHLYRIELWTYRLVFKESWNQQYQSKTLITTAWLQLG